MLIIVMFLNGFMALICLFVAWQLCKLRRLLLSVTEWGIVTERTIYHILHNAPAAIAKGEVSIYEWRWQYQQINAKIKQWQQILSLIRIGQKIWQKVKSKT